MEQFKKQHAPSFEGRGNILIEYHKYTEAAGQRFIKSIEDQSGKIKGDVRAFLLKKGFIDKNNSLIAIAPKKVTIQDGKGIFDEKLIQGADLIIQSGGYFEKPVSANTIILNSGYHSKLTAGTIKTFKDSIVKDSTAKNAYISGKLADNLIVTENLNIYDKAIVRNSTSKYAQMKNSSEADNLTVAKKLDTFDNVKIKNSTAENADIWGKSAKNLIVTDNLNTNNNAVIENSSAKNAYIYGQSAYKLTVTENLRSYKDAAITSSSAKNAWIRGNSKADYLTVVETLNTFDTTKIKNSSAEKAFIEGKSAVGLKVAGKLEAKGDAEISNSSAKSARIGGRLADNLTVEGKLEVIEDVIITNSSAEYADIRGNTKASNLKVVERLNTFDNSTVSNSSAKNVSINGKSANKLTVAENLGTNKNAIITNSSAKNAWINGKATDNLNVTEKFYAYRGNLSNIKAESLYLRKGLTIDGNIQGKIEEIDKEVIIKSKAKFDAVAKKSLPLSRFRAKYSRSNVMCV